MQYYCYIDYRQYRDNDIKFLILLYHQMHVINKTNDHIVILVHLLMTSSEYVTGPAKIDHMSTKKSPIFSVFAVS